MSGFKNLLNRHAEQQRLETIWPALQRAETLLVQAAVAQNRDVFHGINAAVDLPRDQLQLLIRAACGFDAQAICPHDYYTRYPFSDPALIQAGLTELVESGYLSLNGMTYALRSSGRAVVEHWMHSLGDLIDDLDLGSIRDVEINWLLDLDARLISALEQSHRPHGHPIFFCRMEGLHPDYAAPRRWHHWQWVSSLIAAEEDELEYVRQMRGIPALVWFLRRQLWLVDRRPWLVRSRSRADLTRRVVGYAPLSDPVDAIREAIDYLDDQGWLAHVNDGLRLSEAGLAAHDLDESQALHGFLSSWPLIDQADLDLLEIILERLTDRLQGL
jgi:hypothetical protein